MKSDEGFLEISDKTILIQLVNENVIPPLILNKNSKRAVFTALFFYKKIQNRR